MGQILSTADVRKQSQGVWSQFGESKWIPNAEKNAKLKMRNSNELRHHGIGKFAVMVAMGSSLEDNIETLKKHRDKFEITCCDKSFGPLLDHGIKADFVILADASIPFHYIEKWIPETKGVALCSTPYANTEWTHKWKGPRYMYVNKDAIESERTFLPIVGKDMRVMPAGSNVSNAMVVFWTNCDERRNENWGGYERYFLVGYDYSWPVKGNYYAWNNPIPKRYYMNHRTLLDFMGNDVYTSENLLFSAKWLYSYVTTFDLPVVNCSNKGILDIPLKMPLEQAMEKIRWDKKTHQTISNLFQAWKLSTKAQASAEFAFHDFRGGALWQ